jgi:hypothetical protein
MVTYDDERVTREGRAQKALSRLGDSGISSIVFLIGGVAILLLIILWMLSGSYGDPNRMSSRNTTGTTTQSSAPINAKPGTTPAPASTQK